MQTLRIFISSPGDLGEERQIAGKVIERLQGKYWSFVRLDDVFWEEKVVRSTAHYQDELANPGNCDIVVGVLWTRLGSPLPEKFRKASGERYQSGTEWELEMAFDAYDRCLAESGDPSQASPDIVVYRRLQARVAHEDPVREAEAVAQEQALAGYLKGNFFFPDGTIKRPVTQYHTLDEFEELLSNNLEELILRKLPTLKPGFEPPPISGSPFKGLLAFDFADSDRYFGRNREIRQMEDRLRAAALKGLPFLLIYGGSGFGKSSLMRAGLAPVLTRPGGSLPEIGEWRRVSFQPAKGEGTLCQRLASALLLPPSDGETEQSRLHEHWPLMGLAELAELFDAEELSRQFSDDESRPTTVDAIAGVLTRLDRHLLLELDQLEEVFTTTGFDMAQRSAFFQTVHELSGSGRVWVVATMRSEFFPRVAEQPELLELVGKERGYILPPPDRQSLREMIRYPALAARLDYQRRTAELEISGEAAKFECLDDQILADAEASPDSLPLLAFTLRQLYDDLLDPEDLSGGRRVTDLLQWQTYQSIGGLKGAIAKRAREVFSALSPAAQEARHRIFAALVHADTTGHTFARQRAPRSSLDAGEGAREFLEAFLAARLLVSDDDGESHQTVVTLAHDALITHWQELASWNKEHQGDLLARQRLREQTALWLENGRRKSYLLSEARLAEAQRVAMIGLFALKEEEQGFLALSATRSRRKLRLLQTAVAIFAGLALIAALLWRESVAQKKIAEDEKTKAQVSEKAAIHARGTAEGLIDSMLYDLRDKLDPLGRTELLDDVSKQAEDYFKNNPSSTPTSLRNEGSMWQNRGQVFQRSGDLKAARTAYEKSLRIRQRLATADPRHAESQRDLAICYDHLGDIARVEGDLRAVREAFEKSMLIAQRLAVADPRNAQAQRDLSVSYERLGDSAKAEGDLQAAREAFEKSMEIHQRLATADPTNAQAQRDLSIINNKLGSIAQAQGDLHAARGAFEKSLEICQLLATANPRNAEFQRGLSIGYNMLGDLALAERDLQTAHRAFEKHLEIAQHLASADPRNAEAQLDLSIGYEKLGDITQAEGDLQSAREAFEKSLEISQRLATADPSNAVVQRKSSVNYNRLGVIAQDNADLKGAREAFEKCLEIAQRLATADPRNAEVQRDLSVCHSQLGSIMEAVGDLKGARGAYEKSLEIRQRLATADPRNVGAQLDLSETHYNLGEIAWAEGDRQTARAAYGKSLDIRQHLATADPRNAKLQQYLGSNYSALGDIAKAEGDLQAAREAFEKSLEIFQRLATADPRNTGAQLDLSVSQSRLGDIAKAEGNLQAAREAYEKSLEITQRLATADPTNATVQRSLSISYNKLGHNAQAEVNLQAAREAFEKSLEIHQRLATADPRNAKAQRDLSVSHSYLGGIAQAQGDLNGARGAYEKSLEIRQRLAAADPTNAQAQRDLLVPYFKLGELAAAEKNTDLRKTHRKACLTVLQTMEQAGMAIDAPSQKFYEELKKEFGEK